MHHLLIHMWEVINIDLNSILELVQVKLMSLKSQKNLPFGKHRLFFLDLQHRSFSFSFSLDFIFLIGFF